MSLVKIFNKGFNYSQDGPGNRLVYHLQGCNMRCGWCANPEGLFSDNWKEYDTRSVLEEIESCKAMFFDGGGVTFTGGEPTVQFAALKELLEGSVASGVNTAIETNATHKDLEKLFPWIDHIILDFKFADDERQIRYTGVSNKQIRENVKKAFDTGKPVLVRIPVINHINADEAEISEIIRFMTSLHTENIEFELLPYHEYGKIKWEKCGRDYIVRDGFIELERLKHLEKMFRDSGLTVRRT